MTSSPAFAEDGRLQPRAETGLKYGTERSIGTGEMWVPLTQDHDSVLYADFRLMRDDGDNTEMNAGLGYRRMLSAPGAGPVIAGAHVWADRRRSETDHTYYQAAAGVEVLAEDWDVRANGYLPLSDENRIVTPNTGRTNPYMAGSGIFYDTSGIAVEEPQPGLDLEVGVRLPVFEQSIDSVRVYGGGYHFAGDRTDDVTGWRTRLVADISPTVAVGARFQRDDERGSQAFAEATIRFPFSAKKSFRDHGLRARMDESPERDVDIVTGSKIVDTGQRKPVLAAATGAQQRVLHVDNTAAAGGNGSAEQPFNTLKAAEAALQDHDVVYVHAGNGTTTGQDQGIVINKQGVSLIGSGTNFVYDSGRFSAQGASPGQGTLIAQKTTAPVIKNTEPTVDNFTGIGVYVTADKVHVAGLDFDVTSTGHNIFADNVNGAAWDSFTVSDITTRSLTGDRTGVRVQVMNNSTINTVNVARVVATGNQRGVNIASGTGAHVETIVLDDITASGAPLQGISVGAQQDGTIGSITIRRANTFDSVTGINISSQTFLSTPSRIAHVEIIDSRANNNGSNIVIQASANHIGSVVLRNVDASSNNAVTGTRGIVVSSQGANAIIESVTLDRATASDNRQYGLLVTANSNASINSMIVQNSSFKRNTFEGIYLNDDTSGTFNIDFGGGTAGSVGRNSITGNGTNNHATYRDMRLDLDGNAVDARNNWWGQNTGPITAPGTEQIINDTGACPANCGTANTAPALDHDPNL